MANQSIYYIGITILLLFVSTAFYTGCNTYDADFERDNLSDPKSPNFVHSKPSNFTITVENEVINIGWIDKTEYNDGYLIEKAINDSTQFEPFTTLTRDAEGFSDNSRKIGQDTYYRVSSYEIEDGDKNIVHSEFISISVEIIYWQSFYSGDKIIDLRWRSSNDFVDGYRIEEKLTADSTYTLVEVLTDISESDEVKQYNYNSVLQSFQTDVRIVAYQYHGDQMVDIHTVEEILFINSITNVDVTFITETETLIEWGGNVDFAEYYLLELTRDGEVMGQWEMPPTGSFLLEMPQVRGRMLYSIKGFHEGIESRTRNNIINYNIFGPRVSVKSSSLDELYVLWTHPSYFEDGVKPTQFTVERSRDNFEFEEIAVLPGDQFSFKDSNLDPGSTYTYRVRTLTSTPSNPIKAENKNLYAVTNEKDLSIYGKQFTPVNSQFIDESSVALYGIVNPGGSGTQLYPVTFVQLEGLSTTRNFGSENEPFAFALSPDGKRAVELVKGNTAGGYDINIWDSETSSLVNVLQNVIVNTEISPLPAFTRYSPDGELIAVGERYRDIDIGFWNPDSGELINSIEVSGKDLISFYFNHHANEFYVVTHDEILVYDLNSFELTRQIPVSIYITLNSQFLYSDSDHYVIISTGDRKLFKIDIVTGEILDEIAFGNSIQFISANKNLSDIWIHTFNGNVLIDADNFEILQYNRWLYPQDKVYIISNRFLENTAVSFERKNQDDQWFIKKWQRRPHWYVVNPDGE